MLDYVRLCVMLKSQNVAPRPRLRVSVAVETGKESNTSASISVGHGNTSTNSDFGSKEVRGVRVEPADVEAEPANDGSRGLASSQSLVILYRVSDSAEVPKRLIRTSCDAGAPSVPASHVRDLLATDGVDPSRLLRSAA